MKKKLSVFFLLFPFLTTSGFCQYDDYEIKGQYDNFHEAEYVGNMGQLPAPGEQLGEGMTWVLMSHLSMYETTGDKAYLIKFIIKCIEVQGLRFDYALPGQGYDPIWETIFDEVAFYYNGRILMPMAKFCWLVKNDAELVNCPLPQIDGISNNLFGLTFNSYLEFSNWLYVKVSESLEYISLVAWNYDLGFYQNSINLAHPINKQATLGAAFLYAGLYLNDPINQQYRAKANLIGNLYKSVVEVSRDSDCDFQNGQECWDAQMLSDANGNDSYVWFDKGWGAEKHTSWCGDYRSYCSDYYSCYEDVSHAIATLTLPMAYYYTGYNGVFDQNDMIHYRNTFTKNVWINVDDFHLSVAGNELIDSWVLDQYGSDIKAIFRYMILSWIELYKFDAAAAVSPNGYNLVMDFYYYKLKPADSPAQPLYVAFTDNGSGSHLYGLAQTVAAQWDKECPDLIMSNRDLVYSQDFFSKREIIIDPSITNPFDPVDPANSFADPVITDPLFTIEPDVICHMVANDRVMLKHGFHAESGSRFHAYTNPSLCGGNKSMIAVPAQEEENETALSVAEKSDDLEFHVYPNPGAGIFTIETEFQDAVEGTLTLFNTFGQILLTKQILLGKSFVVNLSDQPEGIYFLTITSSQTKYQEKLVIQK